MPFRKLMPSFTLTAHGRVEQTAISRKGKHSALRYFYLSAEKNTSLGTAGNARR